MAAHRSQCADLVRANICNRNLLSSGVEHGRKEGRSRKALKASMFRGLAVMRACFGATHRARSLDPDRLSEHLRRDLGLTNHVEQVR